MRLDETQRRALLEDGYLHLEQAVPRGRVDAALKAVNHSLGEQGIARESLPTFRARTFCPELAAAPPILDLYAETSVAEVAEAAVGPGQIAPPTTGQIALRFPQALAAPPAPRPHIDGLPTALNGVAAGTLYHFTALAAVFLSDVTAPFQGNFTVWPGSHRALAAHFVAHGTDDLHRGFPPVALPPPRQLIVRAGDALLAHYQLAHDAAANLGPHVRYAVFFRLAHRAHDPTSTAPLTDLWREWEGLRAPPAP